MWLDRYLNKVKTRTDLKSIIFERPGWRDEMQKIVKVKQYTDNT